MSAPRLKLFGTTYCHLCDQAKMILREAYLEFEYVDITDTNDLTERYGIRIPVVQRIDSNAELGWPFDTTTLANWLND